MDGDGELRSVGRKLWTRRVDVEKSAVVELDPLEGRLAQRSVGNQLDSRGFGWDVGTVASRRTVRKDHLMLAILADYGCCNPFRA